jgi:23S rRNA pseudouridine2605 synthase
MRLNRFLASAGLGSRRSVEELITTGQVRINGRVVTDLATKVTPEDAVKVGSRLLQIEKSLTAVLNKPRGFVCTASDELDRRTIFDLLPPNWPRVHHVGRLDKDSDGLLIVTNDGDLSLALTHPRYKIDKEYEVLLDKPFDPADRAKLLRGFHIIGGRAKIEHVDILGPNHLRLTLNQGIKRQIRLMLYELGYEVERLIRVRIGPLKIGEMRPGDWRILTPKEIATLKSPEAQPPARKSFIPSRSPAGPDTTPKPEGRAPARKSGPPRPPQRKPVGSATRERREFAPAGKRPGKPPGSRPPRRQG